MEKKKCNKCRKRFTRRWNLTRHLKYIHNLSDDGQHDIVKPKYDRPTYSSPSPIKNEYIMNSENKMSEMNYNLHPPKSHNFTKRFFGDEYYNNGCYQNYELFTVDKKEPKLTIPDGIRIINALRILQHILPRFYPNNVVIRVICFLKYQCYTKHSDEPLKDFYKQHGLWHLWPY